ncbi:MAG: hypothetical protein IAE89_02505 [Anaerolineae bacterium]|nr:hypothetical protein [Anaerolineae bacterium]
MYEINQNHLLFHEQRQRELQQEAKRQRLVREVQRKHSTKRATVFTRIISLFL